MSRASSLVALFVLGISGCDSPAGVPGAGEEPGASDRVARIRDRQVFPIEFEVFNSCSRDGSGEAILLTGMVVASQQLQENPSGKAVTRFDVDFRKTHAVGLTSGRKFRVQSEDWILTHYVDGVASAATFRSTLHIVGQGAGNNLVFRSQFQVSFAADGAPTFHMDKSSLECR
jgi:hypothetical protein